MRAQIYPGIQSGASSLSLSGYEQSVLSDIPELPRHIERFIPHLNPNVSSIHESPKMHAID